MARNVLPAIVFDAGGVLARVARSWQEAARYAGVRTSLPDDPPLGLRDLAIFDRHESSDAPFEDYLTAVSRELGCTTEEAQRTHTAILIEPMPQSLELVAELKLKGFRTGVLSNTNQPHWEVLVSDRFPAIASADLKMASFEVRLHKPNPEIYKAYEHRFSLGHHEIVFFDDSYDNARAAKDRGWTAWRIDPLGDTVAQMRAHLNEWMSGLQSERERR